MKFYPTPISDLFLAELKPYKDDRGFFTRTYCSSDLELVNIFKPITQINHSLSLKVGTVRGMHFQLPPHAEVKMVSCLKGRIFDVAVDIRQGSPTFLQWFGEYLSPDNFKMMVIPEGFAHGFQVIEPNSEILYFHTESYTPEFESGILYDDRSISIKWPLRVDEISERDQNHAQINEHFTGVVL